MLHVPVVIMTTHYRVLRRAGIAGILPAGVWLCRLQRKFGRFLPAGIFRWFYVFVGWRSFCLSKTDPKRRNALVSILVVAETERREILESPQSAPLDSSTTRRVTVRVLRRATITIAKAASMRVRSRASDAECPEAFPVYSVLHALAILVVDEWLLDSGRRCRIFRNARAAFGLSIAEKDFEDVEKSGFVNVISFERYWQREGTSWLGTRRWTMPEDKILCSKHRKKRQRKKQRERERERERKRQTKEWERTNKCAEDTNNLLVKYQEIFSLAEMQFSFLKLTFFYCGWATFCSKKLS